MRAYSFVFASTALAVCSTNEGTSVVADKECKDFFLVKVLGGCARACRVCLHACVLACTRGLSCYVRDNVENLRGGLLMNDFSRNKTVSSSLFRRRYCFLFRSIDTSSQ